MAIHQPYDAKDVFSSPDEARRADATVTQVSLDAFRESAAQPEVRAMVDAARQIAVVAEPELPQTLG